MANYLTAHPTWSIAMMVILALICIAVGIVLILLFCKRRFFMKPSLERDRIGKKPPPKPKPKIKIVDERKDDNPLKKKKKVVIEGDEPKDYVKGNKTDALKQAEKRRLALVKAGSVNAKPAAPKAEDTMNDEEKEKLKEEKERKAREARMEVKVIGVTNAVEVQRKEEERKKMVEEEEELMQLEAQRIKLEEEERQMREEEKKEVERKIKRQMRQEVKKAEEEKLEQAKDEAKERQKEEKKQKAIEKYKKPEGKSVIAAMLAQMGADTKKRKDKEKKKEAKGKPVKVEDPEWEDFQSDDDFTEAAQAFLDGTPVGEEEYETASDNDKGKTVTVTASDGTVKNMKKKKTVTKTKKKGGAKKKAATGEAGPNDDSDNDTPAGATGGAAKKTKKTKAVEGGNTKAGGEKQKKKDHLADYDNEKRVKQFKSVAMSSMASLPRAKRSKNGEFDLEEERRRIATMQRDRFKKLGIVAEQQDSEY